MTAASRRYRAVAALCLCVGAAMLSSCASAPASADVPGAADFAEIRHLVEVCRSIYFDQPQAIRARWGAWYDSLEIVDLRESGGRYLIGTMESARRQEIVIRPTANLANFFTDIDFSARRDARLGILLHSGFQRGALDIYHDIIPRLRPDCDLVLYGHSMGGAEAVILAMFLREDGYRVTRVYTGGQPRFTDGAGAARYGGLPLLRVVNDGDMVPYLPPRGLYTSFGTVLVLLDGPYYCLMNGVEADAVMSAGFSLTFSHGDFGTQHQSHTLKGYIDRLQDKLDRAVQVPFADRERYLVRRPAEPENRPRGRY